MGIYNTELSEPLETRVLALNTNHGATKTSLSARPSIMQSIRTR